MRCCYRSLTARDTVKWFPPFPRFVSIPAPGHPTDIKTEQVLTLLTTSPVRVYFGHGSSLTSACYLTRLDRYPPRKGENESAPFEGLVALVLVHSYHLCKGKKMREKGGRERRREKKHESQMNSYSETQPAATDGNSLLNPHWETRSRNQTDILFRRHCIEGWEWPSPCGFGSLKRNICVQSERQ